MSDSRDLYLEVTLSQPWSVTPPLRDIDAMPSEASTRKPQAPDVT